MSSGNVGAAPNRSRLTAAVMVATQSAEAASKWTMTLRVENLEPLDGGTFAAPGDVVQAIAFDPPAGLTTGAVVTADAEYVGGPFSGVFRLTRVSMHLQ